ncbi:hypothetical protein SDC9_168721 [bioreactor metagenome]|uniref:Uncharacterized protein n=1 Tax=bioreactor metagenome TaxID=1076179 RepID=A0A645G5U3_9ZZZZ
MLNTRFDLSKQKIVITGCQLEDMSKNLISNCIIEDFKANVVSNQKVDLHPPGTGELFTAHLLLLMYCNTSLTDAAMSSGNILTRVLSGMLNAGSRQIELSDILFSKECVEGRM